MSVLVLSEAISRQLVTLGEAIALTEAAFADLDSGRSAIFPPARGRGSDPSTRFGVKCGFDGSRRLPGLKVGSYWPGNRARSIGNHGSTTLLLDDETGLPAALVASTHLTALRTAAADAVAVKHLARPDAKVLGLIGTGHQAYFDALAIATVRPLTEVLVWGRDPASSGRLADRLTAVGLPARAVPLTRAVREADIISTVTASQTAFPELRDVGRGVHISAMGADGPGKQELPLELVQHAALFADDALQATTIGEFQHAFAVGLIDVASVRSLGGVIAGRTPGRASRDEVTIFDSSGLALQDLTLAAFALDAARAAGLGVQVDL